MKLWSSLILSIVCLVVAVTLIAVFLVEQNEASGWQTEQEMTRMRGEVIAALVCGVAAVALMITVIVVIMHRRNLRDQENLRRSPLQEGIAVQDECATK